MFHFILNVIFSHYKMTISTINFVCDVSSILLGDFSDPEAIHLNGWKLLQDAAYLLEEKDL